MSYCPQHDRNEAAKYFHECLMSDDGQLCREYLAERAITEETINDFKLGWCPGDFDIEPRLRNRLIAPLFDPYGDVKAFAGRLLTYKEGNNIIQRGLNYYVRQYFPESNTYIDHQKVWWHESFAKKYYIYGLHASKEYIRHSDVSKQKNYVVVVEGQFDIWGMYSFGIKNVVATLGTAFGRFHLGKLARYADEIITIFDSDLAGVKATQRAFDNAFALDVCKGIQLEKIRLNNGTVIDPDPHDYLMHLGGEKMRERIEQARGLSTNPNMMNEKRIENNYKELAELLNE